MLLPLALAVAQAPVSLELVVPASAGLDDPVGLAATTSDDRLFVVELVGRVRILDGSALLQAPFLDVSGLIHSDWDKGLRDIAFHPQHAGNGLVYLWCDVAGAAGGLDTLLARMRTDPNDPNRIDPGSWVEILRVPQQAGGHGGGELEFGPDGYLYVGIGDGGVSGDPACNAQNPGNLMGTIARIDVDGGWPYAVPADNPFLMFPSYAPEMWHYGLRHPWKWSFDRLTGALWIGDVGQWQREEVNFAAPGQGGLNFGWNTLEGNECFASAGCGFPIRPCGNPGYTPPRHTYTHAEGCSITGGVVYRGAEVPELQGSYLFADFCSARFWSLAVDGPQLAPLVQRALEVSPAGHQLINPVAFGQDRHGEVYVIDFYDDEVYRLVRACGAEPVCQGAPNSTGGPARLAQQGSTSVAANDLAFELSRAPAGVSCRLLAGLEVGQTTLGSGTLCIGLSSAGILRVAGATTGSSGSALLTVDLSAPPLSAGPNPLLPGSRWIFQTWYRDAGPTSNLSEALSVVFCP